MIRLYGTDHTAQSLAERSGSLAQFGGVRLVTLGDGVERGLRVLQFDTGAGLRFDVLVDRAMDIASLTHNGRAIGWHSPTGFRHPGLHDAEGEDGLGWTRSFSGFLNTCGLDHILGPEEVPADTYNYPRKATTRQTLHGRIGAVPARLTGYGERWDGDRCILWAEGTVIQAAVFGEVLHLHRRIEADLGAATIRLTDRVVNAGFALTPHMYLYHINLGYPLLDHGTRYLAPIRQTLWASHEAAGLEARNTGYRTCPGPVMGFAEQVWEHEMAADEQGVVPVAVVNDHLQLGLMAEVRKDQFPCALQWQNFQSGHYVMAIEPATHHAPGNLFARARNEMIWLAPAEDRHYQTNFHILDGAAAIAQAAARITAIHPQPETDYPRPSGQFPALHAAAKGQP